MWSIVGTSAVKQSPKAAKPQAARKAIGSGQRQPREVAG